MSPQSIAVSSSHSIWVKLERYPPVIVRLLAKLNPSTLMSDSQICARSHGNLTLSDVKRLSYAPTWDEVPVSKMKSFCLACGVDFADRGTMRNLNRYLNSKPTFAHLRRDPNFEEYKKMLIEYYEYESNR